MFVLQRGRGNVRKYWECVELVYFVKQCVYKGNPKVEEKSEEETEEGEDETNSPDKDDDQVQWQWQRRRWRQRSTYK